MVSDENVVHMPSPDNGDEYAKSRRLVEELLEDLLEATRAGEIIGLAVVARESDGMCPNMLVGSVGGYTMAGSLATLQHRIGQVNSEE
jgi:hypothetical protein